MHVQHIGAAASTTRAAAALGVEICLAEYDELNWLAQRASNAIVRRLPSGREIRPVMFGPILIPTVYDPNAHCVVSVVPRSALRRGPRCDG